MRRDIIWRGVVAALTIGVSVVLAPAGIIGIAVLASVVLAAEPLTRWRGRGPVDEVVVGVGGVAVVVVAVGVVLAASPLGLTPQSWGVGLGVAALVGLRIAAWGESPRPRVLTTWRRPELLRVVPWVAASVVVAGVALGAATATAGPAAGRPVARVPAAASSTSSASPTTSADDAGVDLTVDPVSATEVEVVVSATSAAGPLEVRVSLGSTEISYPSFSVSPGQPRTTRVTLPPTGTAVISVVTTEGGEELASQELTR